MQLPNNVNTHGQPFPPSQRRQQVNTNAINGSIPLPLTNRTSIAPASFWQQKLLDFGSSHETVEKENYSTLVGNKSVMIHQQSHETVEKGRHFPNGQFSNNSHVVVTCTVYRIEAVDGSEEQTI